MKSDSPYLVPIAIIVAGLIVAASLFFSDKSPSDDGEVRPTIGSSAENIRPVTSDDHILGNPAAAVKVVEFSDLECPFCKDFHLTMHKVMDEYGKRGQVAWVYRHFPLDRKHPKARKEAQATECAAELGGNTAFWAYVDRVFEITPSNNELDLALLPKIAEEIGLERAAFEACLASDRHKDRVQADLEDVVASGGDGTPYSVVIARNNKKFLIKGAQPYQVVSSILNAALKEK